MSNSTQTRTISRALRVVAGLAAAFALTAGNAQAQSPRSDEPDVIINARVLGAVYGELHGQYQNLGKGGYLTVPPMRSGLTRAYVTLRGNPILYAVHTGHQGSLRRPSVLIAQYAGTHAQGLVLGGETHLWATNHRSDWCVYVTDSKRWAKITEASPAGAWGLRSDRNAPAPCRHTSSGVQ